jgi:hypothetical protein
MSHTGKDYLFLSRLKDLFGYIHGVSLCGSPPNIQDREQRGIETTDGFFILVDLPHRVPFDIPEGDNSRIVGDLTLSRQLHP